MALAYKYPIWMSNPHSCNCKIHPFIYNFWEEKNFLGSKRPHSSGILSLRGSSNLYLTQLNHQKYIFRREKNDLWFGFGIRETAESCHVTNLQNTHILKSIEIIWCLYLFLAEGLYSREKALQTLCNTMGKIIESTK